MFKDNHVEDFFSIQHTKKINQEEIVANTADLAQSHASN